MDERGRRRPYRVVFTPAGHDSSTAETGTIVAATESSARLEAQSIARDGGTARVEYIDQTGLRTVIGTYRPRDHP